MPMKLKESRIYVGKPIKFPANLQDVENEFWMQIEDMQKQAQEKEGVKFKNM